MFVKASLPECGGEERHHRRDGVLTGLDRGDRVQIRDSDAVGDTDEQATGKQGRKALGESETEVAQQEEHRGEVLD